jgi:uncharacterized protein YkwD
MSLRPDGKEVILELLIFTPLLFILIWRGAVSYTEPNYIWREAVAYTEIRPLQTISIQKDSTITGQLYDLINNYRRQNNLSPLTISTKLENSSSFKANDMLNRNYWSHEPPTGESAFIFFDKANANYIYAGENLAYGYKDMQNVLNAWILSPKHNEVLLNPNYKQMGITILTNINFQNLQNTTLVVFHTTD